MTENKIEIEPIFTVDFKDAERNVAQRQAMYSAKNHTYVHFKRYKELSKKWDGKYVNADLFKETFPIYPTNPTFYDCPIHNSAAVLSTAYFKEVVQRKDLNTENVVFLTGVPGAGKSHLLKLIEAENDVKNNGEKINNMPVIYEVSMANHSAAKNKIDTAIKAGLKPEIMIVHTTAEQAFDNTIKRFNKTGRGCRLDVMAQIMGGMPESLKKIHEEYPEIPLTICDKRNIETQSNTMPTILKGWEHLDILSSEGSYEQIKDKLFKRLEQRCKDGTISENGFRQACEKGYTFKKDQKLSINWRGYYNKNGLGHLLSNGTKSGIVRKNNGRD